MSKGGLMLRGNQPEMAKQVFDLVERVNKQEKNAPGENLMLQLGTGYGKSKTVIPLAADQANQKGQLVRVIAPGNNQSELDNSLHNYFAKQGVDYKRLDIIKDYVAPEKENSSDGRWWTSDNLKNILNTVTRKEPLGISTEDVQVLMVLRDRLQAADNSPEELALLEKILDVLQYDGINVFDEYDRGVMPGREDELDDITDTINEALAPLNNPVRPDEITMMQSAFLNASKNKICLSATMGTGFTMAALTNSATVDEAATKCKSDPMTTNARFFNWLTKTTPIVSDSTSTS